jgi:diguanylate cyclase (GGDEF)-like protein/PAS domain S-box-containing protein
MSSRTKSALEAEISALKARLAEWEAAAGTSRNLKTSGSAEHERIENALKASEVRYRRLFETAKDGILILDAESGKITDANPFLVSLLGFSWDELVGKTLWEIGSFRDIVANQSAFRQLQVNEYIRYENLPLETKNGQLAHVEFISNVYMVDGSRVIQCNVRDITERYKAEERLQKTHAEALALVAELQRSEDNLRTLNHMNDLLQSCTTQEEAYQVIGLTARELFSGHAGGLAILHPWDQHLETVAQWGGDSPMEARFLLDDCWAMRRGQPHEAGVPGASLLCRHFAAPTVAGYLCVPLMVQGETLGLLSVLGTGTAGTGGRRSDDRQLALTMGEAIKLSLSNLRLREKLREQATRDLLTGLFNRRYLEESLSRELHRARRGNSELCIAMVDLDHFKRLNDTFGHEAGDAVLREVGQVLREKVRKSDISCRYGGEEFVVVLPESSVEATVQRLEEIRILIKALEIRHRDQMLGPTTVSAGIAIASEKHASPRDLLSAADAALYAAKQAGRDRVVVYEPED